MSDQQKNFWTRVDEVSKSPAARRRAYARRLGALATALLCFAFAVLFQLLESFVGIPPFRYELVVILAIVAIAVGFTWGERIATRKFEEHNNDDEGQKCLGGTD